MWHLLDVPYGNPRKGFHVGHKDKQELKIAKKKDFTWSHQNPTD